jgi:hypothetical protein
MKQKWLYLIVSFIAVSILAIEFIYSKAFQRIVKQNIKDTEDLDAVLKEAVKTVKKNREDIELFLRNIKH